jgi:hypothetical protein
MIYFLVTDQQRRSCSDYKKPSALIFAPDCLLHSHRQFLVDRQARAGSLRVPKNPRFITCPKQFPVSPLRREKFCLQQFCTIDTSELLSVGVSGDQPPRPEFQV